MSPTSSPGQPDSWLAWVGQSLQQFHQLGMAPVAVARQPHHLPVLAIDRQRLAAGEAALGVEADRARRQRARPWSRGRTIPWRRVWDRWDWRAAAAASDRRCPCPVPKPASMPARPRTARRSRTDRAGISRQAIVAEHSRKHGGDAARALPPWSNARSPARRAAAPDLHEIANPVPHWRGGVGTRRSVGDDRRNRQYNLRSMAAWRTEPAEMQPGVAELRSSDGRSRNPASRSFGAAPAMRVRGGAIQFVQTLRETTGHRCE